MSACYRLSLLEPPDCAVFSDLVAPNLGRNLPVRVLSKRQNSILTHLRLQDPKTYYGTSFEVHTCTGVRMVVLSYGMVWYHTIPQPYHSMSLKSKMYTYEYYSCTYVLTGYGEIGFTLGEYV